MGRRKVEVFLAYINGCKGTYKLLGNKYKKGEEIPDGEIAKLDNKVLRAELKCGNIKEEKVDKN